MDQQYSRNDLYSLVDSRARREIRTEEELMNYRLYFLDLATFLRVSKQLEADELEDLYVQGFDKEFRREIIRKMRCDNRRRHSDDPWPMEQVTYTATRLLHKGFRSERARTSAGDYYEPRSDPESSSDKQHLSTKCFLPTATHDSLTNNVQGSTELSRYIECEKVPKLVSTSRAQPHSPPEKTSSEDRSPGRLVEAAAATCFETGEFSLGTNRILTTELQEAVELEQVKPTLVEEPLTTKVPFEFEANYNTQRGFSFCSYRASLMATGVSLQESYLRGRGGERSNLGVPAVSRNTHQLTDDPFRSKIPLEFEAERPEEHPKPIGVEVEGLESLTGSPETDRLAYKEVVDSHRAPQHMNHIESKVIARRIQIEEPSRLVIRRKPPEEVLRIGVLKHAARMDALALEVFHGRAASAIYVLFKDSSSESTRALGIRTCAESPAMLTKRSHVTALRVVAARTQVLHTDNYSVTGWLRKIATIEGYEEWGEQRTVWKLPRLRATATMTRATTAVDNATTTSTTITTSVDQRPRESGSAIRWEWGARSADMELDGSSVRFDFKTLYLHLRYSRENGYIRRRPNDAQMTAIPRMSTMTVFYTDGRTREARTAIRWRRGATSADTEHHGPGFCFESRTFYLQLLYPRENGCTQRRTSDIQAAAIRGTTTSYEESQWTVKEKLRDTIQRYYYEWGEWSGRAEGLNLVTATATTLDADRRPCGAGRAIRWIRGMVETGDKLNSSRFRVSFSIFYLHLRYSREAGYLRRTATAIREAAIATMALDADRGPCEEKIVIRWRRGATSADTEHYGSSFYFSCAALYLRLHYSRVDNDFKDRMCRVTVRRAQRPREAAREKLEPTLWNRTQDLIRIATRQRGLKSEQEARCVRSTEATPVGLEGPSFIFRLQAFYLYLRRFREYDCLQGIIGKLPPQRAKATVTRTHMEEQARRLRIDSGVEEGTHLYTVQQRISKSQQDARDARSIETTPSGLQGPSLSFVFKLFYLHLRRFRECDFLQGINEATTNHERSTAKQLRRLQFDLRQRSPKIQDSTDMDAERDGPSFEFSGAAFYSRLGYFRIDDGVKEGTHLYTVQRRISKLQQDARDARSIEAMPSGLDGPSLSLLFKLFYLQLPHFRDRELLQSINESLSVDALTVQRSRSGRPMTASLQDEDAYITVDRSELVGRHVVERLAKGDSIPVSDIVQRHHEVSFYSGDTTDERDVLDILERSGVTYIVQNALLRRGAKDPSVYFRGYVEGTRAVIEAAIAAGVLRYLEEPFDAYNLLPYRSTTPSEPNLEQRSRTQCIRSDVDSDAEPERSFLSFVFMMIYSRIYRSKVLDQVEAQSLISEGKEDAKVPSSVLVRAYSTFEAIHRYLASGLCPPDCEVGGWSSRLNEASACNRQSRRPIYEIGPKIYRLKVTCSVIIRAYTTLRYFVSSSEEVVNEDGRLEVAQRNLAQGLRPPDEVRESSVRMNRESGL
ncbi:hypothetical protein M404DRAFT_27420 [Pisolithus tinctorius Marx 270]|uniref:Uncharacterized protein n=1 Tax=Pisolithus tinctorius Marx 270 TaxID=870435 RepID=A0A0C3NQJ0_PISTI|nr:hypothetical protein M404DRAFT_27420 [Pisolithus tinctorius Marx 270]